jgi:hypothetical protein
MFTAQQSLGIPGYSSVGREKGHQHLEEACKKDETCMYATQAARAREASQARKDQ